MFLVIHNTKVKSLIYYITVMPPRGHDRDMTAGPLVPWSCIRMHYPEIIYIKKRYFLAIKKLNISSSNCELQLLVIVQSTLYYGKLQNVLTLTLQRIKENNHNHKSHFICEHLAST